MLSTTALIRKAKPDVRKVLICTASQSLVQSLSNKSTDADEHRNNHENVSVKLIIQWIPSHVNIPGNEMADTLDNEATKSEDPPQPVSLAAARTYIKKTITDGAPSHTRVAAIYSKLSRKTDKEANKTRKDAITLARLRSSHHAAFGAYRNLMDTSIDPT